MNLEQLHYLVVTIEKGSYANASKTLYITPEAVSKSIGELERELNIKLIIRSGRSIRPTDAGITFAQLAENALKHIDDLRVFARSKSSQATQTGKIVLAVATAHHRGEFFKPSDFERFEKQYPNIHLELLFNSSEACLSALQEGIADASISLGKPNEEGFESLLLFGYKPLLAVSKFSPLAKQGSIGLEQLDGQALAAPLDLRHEYRLLKNQLDPLRVHPRYMDVSPFMEAHYNFLKEGGAMLVAKSTSMTALFSDVVLIPFRNESKLKMSLYISYSIENANRVALLCGYLKSTAKFVFKRVS